MKKLIGNGKLKSAAALMLALLLVMFPLSGCHKKGTPSETGDIVILYTGDVHCGADENLGYATLSAYKNYVKTQAKYVSLVDVGDAVQGGSLGFFSEGENIIDIMNLVGYDIMSIGNHEFDYGIERFSQLISGLNADCIACNIDYTGTGENPLKDVSPYKIISYGDVDVAYIGIVTPNTIASSTPKYFQDSNGNFVFDFHRDSEQDFFNVIQKYVDECKNQGAEYVIAMGHLGTEDVMGEFSAEDVISNTDGIDVFINGHSHTSVIPCNYVANKDGKQVPLTSSGTKLEHIGQVTISEDGVITTTLVDAFPEQDPEVKALIEEKKAGFEEVLKKKVGTSYVDLSILSDRGIRAVRNRETNMGDFCADLFRNLMNADVGLCNGGGIRVGWKAGEITYEDIVNLFPFGNSLCLIETSGQHILDCLEMACMRIEAKADDGVDAVGEFGGFMQVSGLKFTVDTSVKSTVKLDSSGMFESVQGERRVKDVTVMNKNGIYEPINPNRIYKLASINYTLRDGGDGLSMFENDKVLVENGMLDQQAVEIYIRDHLGGKIGAEYAYPQRRITVK